MRAAGLDVKVLKEEFKAGVLDEDWLPIAIANGWILLTKDDRWRFRPAEKEILMRCARACLCFRKQGRQGRGDRRDNHGVSRKDSEGYRIGACAIRRSHPLVKACKCRIPKPPEVSLELCQRSLCGFRGDLFSWLAGEVRSPRSVASS
jgi:PIN like domain